MTIKSIFFFLIHPFSPPPFPELPGSPSLSSAGTAALLTSGSPGSPPSDGVSEAAELSNAAPVEFDVSGALPAALLALPPAG